MSLRRFGPLMLAVGMGFLVIGLRLFQVQIVEHAVWAREAANLVRSGTIEPYRRGSIYDRKGRTLARDEEVYEIEFVWRGFRRGHPLGQVAQARSLLYMRPVPLTETLANLKEWAAELALLSPAEIDAFGRGAALELGSLAVPASADPAAERRGSRQRDLHFYVRSLLGLERRASRAIDRRKGEPSWNLSYLELAAAELGTDPVRMRSELERRVERSVGRLGRLAPLLGLSDEAPAGDATALAHLIELVEASRREVEDATADDLFAKAAGTPAWWLGRNLARLDLEWLRRCMTWDDARLSEWVRDRGGLWPRAVEAYLAGHVLARFKVGHPDPAERVAGALAHFFLPPEDGTGSTPRDWRRGEDLVALASLEERIVSRREPPAGGERHEGYVLPFQDPELRAGLSGTPLVEALLAHPFSEGAFANAEAARAAAARMVRMAASTRPTWDPGDLDDVEAVLVGWWARLERRIGERFDERALLPGERIVLSEEWRDVASQERAYVVRDRSARARRVVTDPAYDLVHLVTRYPRDYAGFVVRSTTRRALLRDGDPSDPSDPPGSAEKLLGTVQAPYLADLLGREADERELHELTTKLEREEVDRERILGLVGSLYHEGEYRGGTGIEGYFDAELSGRNGYRETQGLADRRGGALEPIHEPAVDGADLVLTLDLDLQRAAERVLAHPPAPPPGEDEHDPVWRAHPVGAIVLATVEGDVLAAASEPTREGEPGLYQDGQRRYALERTLRRYTFQTPGSVFKPFVAAWALEFLALDPGTGMIECRAVDGDVARYGVVRCHNEIGHSALTGGLIDLETALVRSCNSYFSFLGEHRFDAREMRALAQTYGFGRPTGVRCMDDGRLGLREDTDLKPPLAARGEISVPERQRLANGLSHLDVVPMQVARAYAGLATGHLPSMRLVASIGGVDTGRAFEPLPIDARHLDRVRRALVRVVHSPEGTAFGKGLDERRLGFRVAAKTGSADYAAGKVPRTPLRGGPIEWIDGVRKHTWVAGWFPADDPRAVFVVYVHDTSATSSHGAVYVAADLLAQPAVREWLAEELVRTGGGE